MVLKHGDRASAVVRNLAEEIQVKKARLSTFFWRKLHNLKHLLCSVVTFNLEG